MTRKYKVLAKVVSYAELEVEASSQAEAWDTAEKTDGGDFTPKDEGYFEVVTVTPVN